MVAHLRELRGQSSPPAVPWLEIALLAATQLLLGAALPLWVQRIYSQKGIRPVGHPFSSNSPRPDARGWGRPWGPLTQGRRTALSDPAPVLRRHCSPRELSSSASTTTGREPNPPARVSWRQVVQLSCEGVDLEHLGPAEVLAIRRAVAARLETAGLTGLDLTVSVFPGKRSRRPATWAASL